jgi:hypothetical protein
MTGTPGGLPARQRAARVQAQADRQRAAADRRHGVSLPAIRVRVKGDSVWALAGGILPVQRLGPLEGSCPGIFSRTTPAPPGAGDFVSELIKPGSFGVRYAGTLFIAFADGSRFDRPLNVRNRAELREIEKQIARLNALADNAS